ncbi:hypothetical protein WJX73_010586 [Symbiochloris irregularis]|uniref:Uncharacterized protein n=1 Tax=Symbiochloris irregularis TaxID=706552 RepID=A0AAW1NNU2_9CHLO
MRGCLTLHDGSTLLLEPDRALVLGRAHASPSAAAQVSRQQCQVSFLSSSQRLLVCNKGANPTLLIPRQQGSTHTTLTGGQSAEIAAGDGIALLSSHPEDTVTFTTTTDLPSAGPDKREEAVAESQPVMVILCGIPGSGKSTFCNSLMSRSQQPWTRVCQDAIKGTKRRQRCVSAAREAMKLGRNCLIDRCNFDAEQRKDFVALAKELGCQVHAVVLRLPNKLCAQRAADRIGHEGNVEGEEAKKVVGMMSRPFAKSGVPGRQEGFASIIVCNNDTQVARALTAWANYSPANPDPSVEYSAHTSARQLRGAGAWQGALQRIARDPHSAGSGSQAPIAIDDQCVMINDLYPKARCHALVVARDASLQSPDNLTREHIPLLQHMQEEAMQWVQQQQAEHPDLPPFRMGFHSVPSLPQLHMHVISQDFDSPQLKHKKHWISFNGTFFLQRKSAS